MNTMAYGVCKVSGTLSAEQATEELKSQGVIVDFINPKDLIKFKDLIGFAMWQALCLPETDPRRDFIRQGNELISMIDGNSAK